VGSTNAGAGDRHIRAAGRNDDATSVDVNTERTNAAIADGARTLAVGALIGLATYVSIALTRPAGGVTIIWIASGLLAGVVLTSPHRLWVAYLVAAFLGNLIARASYGDPLYSVIDRGLASTAETVIVVYALRHFVGNVSDAEKLRRVAYVATGSTLIACAVSALIAAGSGAAPFLSTFASWFMSHSLGMVIFATSTGIIRHLGATAFGLPGRRWRFARSMALLAATTLWVFSQSRYPLLFLIYPPLLLAVFRHRFGGLAIGVALIVVISIAATASGSGPISLVAGAALAERTLLLQVFLGITCLTALPVAIMLAERGLLAGRLRRSERSYRLLADNSRDLVVRMRADGHRLYISPSVTEVLGWDPAELGESRWDLVHPDDREMLADELGKLLRTGEPATVLYRAQHKYGYHVWIEALARRVPSSDPAFPAEIVYSGRDVTLRMQAEQALAENQHRLRAIADNLPALISHVDASERYTFVNEHFCESLGRGPEVILGQTIPAVLGWRVYNEIRPRVQTALRGEKVAFEAERTFQGQPRTYQASYIPDVGADGKVNGLYILLFDVSKLKQAERELASLARYDSLTGLANRFHFNERVALALARQNRTSLAIALLYIDIDHFKKINDTLGHAVGDAVLREFAARLRASVRETDLAARLGGDEFVVIVEDVEAADVPEIIARKLLAANRQDIVIGSTSIAVGVSIGIGVVHAGKDAESLIHIADEALYAAKAAGRNTYRVAQST
jgi:diguanylate cyclase (GGDEF)-like protein/PAS domain S-box-containing protein